MGMVLSKLPYNRGASLRRPDRRGPTRRLLGRTRQSELTDMIALTVGLAVFVGISLGLLGGGGSILTVPLLAYVAGMEPKHAIATSLLVVGVTSAIAAITHARAGRVRWRIAAIFGAGGHGRRLRRRPAGPLHSGHGAADGFAVIMIAAGVAMLRGRKDCTGTDGGRLPVVRIVAAGRRRRR